MPGLEESRKSNRMMERQGHMDISNFFVTGIDYRKSDAEIRGKYGICNDKYYAIINRSPTFGIAEFFILSTCNRTEIYGFAMHANQLQELLCTQSEDDYTTFAEISYTKQGNEAVQHLFSVGAGLDSQILGDYEIVGQIKQAAKFAKDHGRIHTFTERLVNCMLQSSKGIKNQTGLSGGTISISYAAVQYIRENVKDYKNKKILLFGTGKIGRNTCKNMVDYLGTKDITLINRTMNKASDLADELGLNFAPICELPFQLAQSDIILVATHSQEPTIMPYHIEGMGNKLIIDLSIPYNVSKPAQQLSNVTFIDVDDLSKIKDKTLLKRQAEIPTAKAIINSHIEEFLEWYNSYKNTRVLETLKATLGDLHTYPAFKPVINANASPLQKEKNIQQTINTMAVKMKVENQKGCQYIEAINEFLARSSS